jgi:hypothetical protein
MAMNKSEKERLAQLEAELRKAKALRYPTDPIPETLPLPKTSEKLVRGWDFNTYSKMVEVACTTSYEHSYGCANYTTTQRAHPVFATRLHALIALRHAVTNDFARQLASIDEKIENERANPTPLPPFVKEKR